MHALSVTVNKGKSSSTCDWHGKTKMFKVRSCRFLINTILALRLAYFSCLLYLPRSLLGTIHPDGTNYSKIRKLCLFFGFECSSPNPIAYFRESLLSLSKRMLFSACVPNKLKIYRYTESKKGKNEYLEYDFWIRILLMQLILAVYISSVVSFKE